jgi:hypothetical protein
MDVFRRGGVRVHLARHTSRRAASSNTRINSSRPSGHAQAIVFARGSKGGSGYFPTVNGTVAVVVSHAIASLPLFCVTSAKKIAS